MEPEQEWIKDEKSDAVDAPPAHEVHETWVEPPGQSRTEPLRESGGGVANTISSLQYGKPAGPTRCAPTAFALTFPPRRLLLNSPSSQLPPPTHPLLPV